MTSALLAFSLMAMAGHSELKTMDNSESMSTTAVEDGQEPKEGEEVAVLHTSKGDIVIKFFPDKAPMHVASFKKLVKEKFYDGTRFHRCIPGFMIQGGDPNSKELSKSGSWGTGGPDFRLDAEFNDVSHQRGILSMARSQDPDSAGSQFFIVVKDSKFLDHQYTAFGKVVKGMDVADEIVKTGSAGENGKVKPEDAAVVTSAEVKEWPIKD